VYDGFLQYFESKSKDNKNAKAIYNKLSKNTNLRKGYKLEELKEICSFCNSSLTIRDLINKEDINIKTDGARFNLEFINSKYNHLDILNNNYNNIIEVDEKEYYKIKNESSYYIEIGKTLMTLDKTYKIKKSAFEIAYNEWKDKVKYNKKYILVDSDEYKLITKYDYSLHTFFNDFEINNELYKEIDLKKAYFNYSDINYNKYYVGMPSGSFWNFKVVDNFDIDLFNKQIDIVGFYEVQIVNINDKEEHFKVLGLTKNSIHTFTTPQINLLKEYIDFKFLNISISPSCDISFSKNLLEKFDGVKAYCKIFGLMFISNNTIDINIKPLKLDENYYSVIQSPDYEMYNVDGIIKLISKKKEIKTHIHQAYFINSYCRNLIIDQLLKMDINQVFGVKVDSIIYKKDYNFQYDNQIFSEKKGNIETLLKSNITYGNSLNLDDEIEVKSLNFKPFYNSNDYIIDFKPSFLQTGEIPISRKIFLSGMGGSGKSYSILKSSIPPQNICYSTSSWNLMTGQKEKNPDIKIYSIPNLTGDCNGKATEKIYDPNIKTIVLDEYTLLGSKVVNRICNLYKEEFIILIGDVDEDNYYYQCTLPDLDIKIPSGFQIIKYFKNYRFDTQLNNRLLALRDFMKSNNNKFDLLKQYIKDNFKECIYKLEDIKFDILDVGISSVNDNIKLEKYLYSRGTLPQYFIKETRKDKGHFKGAQLLDIPIHNNYETKLFKSIHSFQGLDLTQDNNIVININNCFDFQLFYTALSRARRINQIEIIEFI
jgi:hypothetical protein